MISVRTVRNGDDEGEVRQDVHDQEHDCQGRDVHLHALEAHDVRHLHEGEGTVLMLVALEPSPRTRVEGRKMNTKTVLVKLQTGHQSVLGSSLCIFECSRYFASLTHCRLQ